MDQAGTLSPPQGARPGTIAVWLQASRAFTLGMPFMSVTVGSFLALYAGAHFSWPRYFVAVIAAMLLQAAANMINDYYDFVKGTDRDNWESPDAFGPGLVIQQGFLSAEQIRLGGLVTFALGSALGGWSLHLLGGRLRYVHNLYGKERYVIESEELLGSGVFTLNFAFEKGDGPGGKGSLHIDGRLVGESDIPRFTPSGFNGVQAGLTCGYEWGPSVGDGYHAPFRFNGTIKSAVVEATGPVVRDPLAELAAIMSEQ